MMRYTTIRYTIINVIFVLAISVLPLALASDDNCNDGAMVSLGKKLDTDSYQACLIAGKIITQVEITQDNISRIANSKVEYERKTGTKGLIENAIEATFEGKYSIIQVTSLTTNRRASKYIEDYLEFLANLSATGIYNDVKITFYKDQTKLLNIEKIDVNTYLFKLKTFQEFIGCKSDTGYCYHDITEKIFHAKLTNKTTSPLIKIQEISAMDTYSYDQFKNRQNSIFGGAQ